MADISDVETALVTAIAAAVYPTGTGGTSAIGAPCRVYRGWPDARALDADLAAGTVNVTVFPKPGMTKNTTRFPLKWHTISKLTPTITVSETTALTEGVGTFEIGTSDIGANPSSWTFAGTAGVGNICGIRSAGQAYAYAAAATDAPADVAAALADLVPNATVSGATVSVPSVPDMLGRVVSIGTMLQETRRQVQGFQVTCWCPSPAMRDTAGSIIDGALAPIEFLTLADGTGGRLLYVTTLVNDEPSKDALWRRDFVYTVEYPTTLIQTAAEMLFGLGSTVVKVTLPNGDVDIATANWEPQ